MKHLRLILIISILLNAGFAVAYFTARSKSAPLAVVDATNNPSLGTVVNVGLPRTHRTILSTTNVVTNALQWAEVESEDYQEYIKNMREIGMPEETIRDIIIADINKLYGRKMAGLYPSAKDYKFWQADNRNRPEDRERERKRRDLEREKKDLIQELLGVDYETEMAQWSGRPDDDEWRTGFLSPEKQAALKSVQDKFRELERSLFAGGDFRNPENREKFLALRQQRDAELAKTLGEKDYQEYQLRNSFTARNMRDNLSQFQPSEAEFRQIFELRKSFDEQYAMQRDGGDEAAREQRRLAQQQLNEQLKATLGPERYRQYELAQDDRYRSISEFVERSNLPKQTAETLYDVRKTAETAREEIQKNPKLTGEQKTAALTQIAQDTQGVLGTLLGDKYSQYARDEGRWLERIAQTTESGASGNARRLERFQRAVGAGEGRGGEARGGGGGFERRRGGQ